jgi:hypothetical protein
VPGKPQDVVLTVLNRSGPQLFECSRRYCRVVFEAAMTGNRAAIEVYASRA